MPWPNAPSRDRGGARDKANANEGDRVKKGQALIELDAGDRRTTWSPKWIG